MSKYLVIAKTLLTEFRAYQIEQVGRDFNSHVDALAGLASIFQGKTGWTIVVDLISIPNHETRQILVLSNIEIGPRWIDPIVEFLRHDKLSKNKREVNKL